MHILYLTWCSSQFCWIDKWFGMTMQDIRALEECAAEELVEVRVSFLVRSAFSAFIFLSQPPLPSLPSAIVAFELCFQAFNSRICISACVYCIACCMYRRHASKRVSEAPYNKTTRRANNELRWRSLPCFVANAATLQRKACSMPCRLTGPGGRGLWRIAVYCIYAWSDGGRASEIQRWASRLAFEEDA